MKPPNYQLPVHLTVNRKSAEYPWLAIEGKIFVMVTWVGTGEALHFHTKKSAEGQ
jgi:hypothetical protein